MGGDGRKDWIQVNKPQKIDQISSYTYPHNRNHQLIMGVGNDRHVYYRPRYENEPEMAFVRLPEPLGGIKHVSVGSSGIWAVHHDGTVFYQETHLSSSSRKTIPGRLYQISANTRGYVY